MPQTPRAGWLPLTALVIASVATLSAVAPGMRPPAQDGTGTTKESQEPIGGAPAPSCLTTECHAEYTTVRFTHGPVVMGTCLTCHTYDEDCTPYESGDDHWFDVVEEDGRLCAKCHESKLNEKFVHYPLRLSKCVTCHDPHGSDNPGMVRHATMAQNCYECHEQTHADDPVVHAPVRVGACTVCHDPHGSSHPLALVASGPDLCLRCHTGIAEKQASQRHAHRPFVEDCTRCHSPHDGQIAYQLREAPPQLCLGCHVEMAAGIESGNQRHGALDNERSCLMCHDPHSADFTRQLLDTPINLCLTCHQESLVGVNRVIRDMRAFLDENPDHHGPIRTGDCTACHNPHWSDFAPLLRKHYPEDFYAPFQLDTYDLCFSCHEQSLVLDPATDKLTGFRNGTKNLHFVHVNQDKKGRTCRACHDVHASKQPKHITESVPFGKWTLPIEYQQSPNGGSCSPGCHQPRGYDRIEAVVNDLPPKVDGDAR